MPEPLLYCKAMGAAAIVSALIVLAIASLRRVPATWLNGVCVAAVGAGLASGFTVLSLRFVWPPLSGLDRLLTIILPATLAIEWVAGHRRLPRWGAWAMRLSIAAAAPRVLLHGSVYLSESSEWTGWQTHTILLLLGVLLCVVWGLLSQLSTRAAGVSIPLALAMTIQSAGVTVMVAGYIKGGAAAIPLASSLVATSIAAAWIAKRRDAALNSSSSVVIGIAVVGLFGILFIGRFFGRISSEAALTMMLAPLLCWVSETPLLRHRKPWIIGAFRLGTVAIPLLVLLAAAKRDFDRDIAPMLGP
ncbi:hypothetical protein Pla52o_01220 [Novipirellula galeiformis]|uniref:Uncharacterized protein n=1 Tax=Novipirellula galeiformis TaxID=2528004 RepID=A0A5C6CU44_9BACT|nr:hypothetical protein [Novipirellula galeiformis]TWU26269.1 hypothetical protein Pla52o_01220 [Novipirellula galeiformis]